MSGSRPRRFFGCEFSVNRGVVPIVVSDENIGGAIRSVGGVAESGCGKAVRERTDDC
jgi:hypothetical protein